MVSTFVDNQFQFAEMNIRNVGNAEKLVALVKRAVRMGYDSIVINTDIGDPEKSSVDMVTSFILHCFFAYNLFGAKKQK